MGFLPWGYSVPKDEKTDSCTATDQAGDQAMTIIDWLFPALVVALALGAIAVIGPATVFHYIDNLSTGP